jgi:hypothetical protein
MRVVEMQWPMKMNAQPAGQYCLLGSSHRNCCCTQNIHKISQTFSCKRSETVTKVSKDA